MTAFALADDFSVKGLDFSPIQGGHGNIEFLAHLEKSADPQGQVAAQIPEIVEKAHKEFKDEKE